MDATTLDNLLAIEATLRRAGLTCVNGTVLHGGWYGLWASTFVFWERAINTNAEFHVLIQDDVNYNRRVHERLVNNKLDVIRQFNASVFRLGHADAANLFRSSRIPQLRQYAIDDYMVHGFARNFDTWLDVNGHAIENAGFIHVSMLHFKHSILNSQPLVRCTDGHLHFHTHARAL